MLDRIGFEQSAHTRNRQHPESSLWRPSRTIALVIWVSERVDEKSFPPISSPVVYRDRGHAISGSMATYTVTPKADRTCFDVSILDGEGALQTTLNFANEAEANAWVTQATRMTKSQAPGRAFGNSKYP